MVEPCEAVRFSAERAEAVRALMRAAFPGPEEAELVDALRRNDDAAIELVALDGGELVGAVMFSRLEAPFRALALAPVAVSGPHRRRGVAATLIAAGLAEAGDAGWEAVFVLGDPAYYGRFGFSAAEAAGHDCSYAGPFLMRVSLTDPPPSRTGRIVYSPAFAALC